MPNKKYTVTRKSWLGKATEERTVEKVHISQPCHSDGGTGAGPEPPLEIYSVMGQEDLFRKEDGVRVINAGTGRIVWGTTAAGNSRVYYSANTELLDEDTGVIVEETKFHDIFIENLNVDSLYAFEVETVTPEGQIARSDTFFFVTGGEVTQESLNLMLEVITQILTFDEQIIELTGLSDESLEAGTPNESTLTLEVSSTSISTISSHASTLDEQLMFTSYQIV